MCIIYILCVLYIYYVCVCVCTNQEFTFFKRPFFYQYEIISAHLPCIYV